MENTEFGKKDISLPLVAVVTVGVLLLSGCTLTRDPQTPEESISSGHSDEAMKWTEEEMLAMEGDDAMMATEEEGETMEMAKSVADYRVAAMQPFDHQQYEAAMSDGKTVFLDFFASWCPTCRANKPVVEGEIVNHPDVVGFRVDYDTAVELKKEHSVTSQSTYILLKNGEEIRRALGSLTNSSLARLLGS